MQLNWICEGFFPCPDAIQNTFLAGVSGIDEVDSARGRRDLRPKVLVFYQVRRSEDPPTPRFAA